MKDFLQLVAGFTDSEAAHFLSAGRLKKARKKEVIFTAGSSFSKLLFLKTGLIRAYRIVDGKDVTYFFFSTNEFAVDFQSFLTDTQSPLYFETLAETEYYEFSKSAIYKMYGEIPRLEKLGRLMAEQAYLSAAERLKQFQTDDLETRYTILLKKNPSLILTIPQHYISSYLGVKPQSLSRIKAKILQRI